MTIIPGTGPNANVAIKTGTSANSYLNAGNSGNGKYMKTSMHEIAVSIATVVISVLFLLFSSLIFLSIIFRRQILRAAASRHPAENAYIVKSTCVKR